MRIVMIYRNVNIATEYNYYNHVFTFHLMQGIIKKQVEVSNTIPLQQKNSILIKHSTITKVGSKMNVNSCAVFEAY